MEFRAFNQNEDEPANGWTGETVRHALQQGKKLVVDQRGDIWELDQEGRQKDGSGDWAPGEDDCGNGTAD